MISKAPFLVKKYYSKLHWKIPTEDKTVFLTFDDGPTPGVTEHVLQLLKDHQAGGSFFCVGKNVEDNYGLYEQILAEGHAVGNHSMNHISGWKVNSQQYYEDVMLCQKLVDSNLFRPPYGKIKRAQASMLLPNFEIVMWSLLTRDYDLAISKEKCMELAVSGLFPGSIIVFHDSKKAESKMLYALEGLLKEMQKKGFTSKKLEL